MIYLLTCLAMVVLVPATLCWLIDLIVSNLRQKARIRGLWCALVDVRAALTSEEHTEDSEGNESTAYSCNWCGEAEDDCSSECPRRLADEALQHDQELEEHR